MNVSCGFASIPGNMKEKCPRCDSTIVVERDCPECYGEAQFDYGRVEFCEVCQGVGSIPGQWECIECSHEWNE